MMIRQLSDQDMDSVLSNRGNSKRGDRFIYWDGCPLLAGFCPFQSTAAVEANNLPLPFGSVLRYSMIEAIAQSDGHLD
jgi:hypothetical protein